MNINIIIAINNEIARFGLLSIIQNKILGSNVLNIDKSDILNKLSLNFFDIVIVELRKKNKEDFELLNNLIVDKNKTKIFVLTNKDMDSKTLKLIKFNNIEVILNDDNLASIIRKIRFNIQYYQSRNTIRKRKMNKLKSLNNLLSNRELEIGTLLIKGHSISTIALKKRLAKSTVSTYKKRIYEKTNVNNIIDLAMVYNKYLIPSTQ